MIKLSKTNIIYNFRIVAWSLSIIIIAICTILFYNDYKTRIKIIKNELISKNERVERKFVDSLLYTKHIMKYVSSQIEIRKNLDDEFINQLLISYRVPEDSVLSWSTFSWADKNHHLIISSNYGIDRKNYGDLSKRDYIPKTVQYPKTLQTGTPIFGIKSNLWSVPVGYGVTKNNQYIGAVVTGIGIEGLKSKLDETITDHKISFALVDVRDGIIITNSNNFDEDVLAKIKSQKFNSSDLVYLKNLENYPYIIFTSYHHKIFNSEIKHQLMNYFLSIGAILFLVNIPLLFFKIKLITPIIQLSEAAKAISQDQDELGILLLPETKIAEINALSEQLKAIYEYKINLLHAKKSQNNFFSNMSHELRTPLTGVMSYAELMKNEIHGPLNEDYKKISAVIFKSGCHLLSLIDELLNFSKLNSGKVEISNEKLNIASEIQDTIEIVTAEAAKYDIVIHTDFQHHNYKLKADKSMLKRTLLNLLSNAIKFSHHGGLIDVMTRINNIGQLQVIITDHGIGIRQEDIELILEEYGQAKNSRKINKNQGFGLGLPISKKMIALHQAELKIDRIVDKETTVTITFPRERLIDDSLM